MSSLKRLSQPLEVFHKNAALCTFRVGIKKKLDGKNDFDCARKWVACDCTEAELARKETGNWVSTLTMWQSIVGSMFEKLEESSIFSVLYQPASASMKSARDISVMSTNLDARRTQQVSFMLLFSCLWPLMGSIQYVNNMIKLKAHSRVCVCMLAAVACMNGRDDDDDHVYNFVHCGWKCCKMDPSVILNEYSSWLKLLLVTVHA